MKPAKRRARPFQGLSDVRMSSRARFLLTAAFASLAVSGCAVGPDFQRPAAPAVTAYTPDPIPSSTAAADMPGGEAQRFLEGTDVSGQWWTLFGSDALNTLVTEALRANPDLAAAQAALRQAHDNYLAAGGALFPSVTANSSVTRQQNSPQNGDNVLNLYNASVNVSYLLDVFGGTRRNIEASGALEENSRFTLEATYLTLISNVLTAAIQAASLSAQIAATQDIATAQSAALDLMNQQFELGAVAKGDVLAEQSQLAQTQATLPGLQKQLAQVQTQLTTLLGRYPVQDQIPNIQFANLKLPQELPLSVPSKLVEQRPDVRSSEALLHQASANIGVSIANSLPAFTLTGGLSSATNSNSASLFNADTIAWNLGLGLAAPIFRGGTLAHQRAAALDAYDRAAAQYKSTVLTAFGNVANVLHALEFDAETLKAQLYAEQTAQASLDITTERYRAGALAYLSLLDAQRTYQQARIALVQAQATRYADTVALFQALGGGWWNRQDVSQTGGHEVFPLP